MIIDLQSVRDESASDRRTQERESDGSRSIEQGHPGLDAGRLRHRHHPSWLRRSSSPSLGQYYANYMENYANWMKVK